jgi:hypothetical protein
MKRFLHLKENRTSHFSKYFLPLLFRDYNYRTGGQPIPTRHLLLVITIIGVLCSEFLYSKSTLVPDRIGIPLFSSAVRICIGGVFFLE